MSVGIAGGALLYPCVVLTRSCLMHEWSSHVWPLPFVLPMNALVRTYRLALEKKMEEECIFTSVFDLHLTGK